jgi:hypothetical protein
MLARTLKPDGTRYPTQSEKGKMTALLAGTWHADADGTSNPTQSEKGKKGGENGIGTKPRTGAIVCPKLVLRDRIKNEMWYRHSLTDQPMIDKLTK